MLPRRVVAVALVVGSMLTACTTSDPRAGDRTVAPPGAGSPRSVSESGAVVLTGTLHRPDGTAAAGRPLLLTKETTGGDVVADLFTFAFTLGLATLSCFDPAGALLASCATNGFTTTTLADGRYALELSDAEARTRGDRRKLTLTSALPKASGGGGVAAALKPGAGVNRLPTLTFWQPQVTGSGTARPSWTRLPAASAADPSYALAYSSPSGLQLGLTDVGNPANLDARLLEDTRGTVTVNAQARQGGVDLGWTAPAAAYGGTAGAPASRSRPCTVTLEARPSGPPGRCWLTDGAFATSYPAARPRSCRADRTFPDLVECASTAVTSVSLDLGRPLPLDLVVVRGDCFGCHVELSTDGRSWSAGASVPADGQLREEGAMARFVRVRSDPAVLRQRPFLAVDGASPGGAALPALSVTDLSTLTELSVWPGSPRRASTAAQSAQELVRRSPLPFALAVLLLLALTAALAYAAGSRRRV